MTGLEDIFLDRLQGFRMYLRVSLPRLHGLSAQLIFVVIFNSQFL